MDDRAYSPESDEFKIAGYCILIGMPIVYILSFFFRSGRGYADRSYETDKAILIEENNDSQVKFTRSIENLSKIENFRRTLGRIFTFNRFVPVIVTAFPENYTPGLGPRTAFLLINGLALLFILVLLIIFTVILLLHAPYLPFNRSIRWITSVIIATLADLLIIQPLLLCLVAAVVSWLIQIPHRTTRIKIIEKPEIEKYNDDKINDKYYLYDLDERRSQACYLPLAVKRERLIRVEMYAFWIRKWSLLDSLVLFVYLCAFFFIIDFFSIKNCKLGSERLMTLTEPSASDFGFYNVGDNYSFINYLTNNLFPKLYNWQYYNGMRLNVDAVKENDKSGRVLYFHRVMGLPRLRQKRVQRNTCKLAMNLTDINVRECNPLLPDEEYKGPLDIGRKPRIWDRDYLHYTLAESSYELRGESGHLYDEGGYIALLGHTEEDSIKIMQELSSVSWIDHLTRVVFFEAVMYDIDTNMFTVFVLMCENFGNGFYVNRARAYTWTVSGMSIEEVMRLIITIIIVLIMLLRFIYLIQLYSYRRYFQFISLNVQLLAVITGVAVVIVWCTLDYIDFLYKPTFRKSLTADKYVSMYGFYYRDSLRKKYLALFTAFAVVRVLFYVQVTNNIQIFSKTLNHILRTAILIFCTVYIFLLIFENITIVLGNPVFPQTTRTLPNFVNFRQLANNMLNKENLLHPFCVCFLALFTFFIFRIILLYYYACSKFNLTNNLLSASDKWKLINFVPYNLNTYVMFLKSGEFKRMRGGQDTKISHVTEKLKPQSSLFLTQQRLKEISHRSVQILTSLKNQNKS